MYAFRIWESATSLCMDYGLRYKITRIPKVIAKVFKLIWTICTLREKCPYLELFWSVFSLIRTGYHCHEQTKFFIVFNIDKLTF